MSNKVFLETDEYDIFIFPVPESLLKGIRFLCTVFPRKKMIQWAVSWMEKLHPCFDGRFIYDLKFFREKGRVMALVTVAEKMKIAARLVNKHTAVFVRRPDTRRVFEARSSLKKGLCVPAAFLLLVTVVLSCLSYREPGDIQMLGADNAVILADDLASYDAPQEEPESFDAPSEMTDGLESIEDVAPAALQTPVVFEAPKIHETPVVCEESGVLPEPSCSGDGDIAGRPSVSLRDTPFIDEFLCRLSEIGCRINGFRWQTSPCCSAVISVEGCWPEEIYGCAVELCGADEESGILRGENLPVISFSSISCADNIPHLSVVLDYSGFENEVLHGNEEPYEKIVPIFSKPVQSLFRNLIVESSGSVISESISPPVVTGVVPVACWEQFSAGASRLFAEGMAGGLGFAEFSALDGSCSVSVSLSFDSEKPDFFPVESIAVLFPCQKTPESLQCAQEAVLQNELPEIPAVPLRNLVEIGSVRMDDGMYVSFFRNQDGTITKGEPYEK